MIDAELRNGSLLLVTRLLIQTLMLLFLARNKQGPSAQLRSSPSVSQSCRTIHSSEAEDSLPCVSLDEDESTPSKRPKRRKTTFTTVQAATSAPATSQETPVPVTLEKKKKVKVRDTIEGSPERGSTAWKALSSAQKASPSATEAIGRGIHMLHPDSSRGSYAPSPHFPPILTSLCRRYKTTARRPTGAVWGRCGVGDRSAVCAGPRVEPHTHRNGPAFSVCRRRSTTSKHFFLT
ncbi:unnamed protein product, partial [Clonostachys chloroleuca]